MLTAVYHGSVNQNESLYNATIKSVESLNEGDKVFTTDSMGVCFWAACAGIRKGLDVSVFGSGEFPKNAVHEFVRNTPKLSYRQIGLKHLNPDIQNWLLTYAKDNDILSELPDLIVDEKLISYALLRPNSKLFMLTDGINRRTARVFVRAKRLNKPIGYLLAEPSQIVTPLFQLL